MQASKNGFFYVLDRQTGQFISAKAFVNGITWATGINPETGRPQESPSAHDGWQAVLVSPAPGGGHNWYPMAFHPATGLVYVPAREKSVFLAAPDKNWKSNPTVWNRGEDAAYDGPVRKKALASPPMTGHLIAWNPVEQHEAWRADLPLVESGGVLATGGNLVFQGRSDGIFCAYRATDGKKLWEFDAGTGIMAPPVTYLRDGVQYVTLMVGWGGAAGLVNLPGSGPVKRGFGRVLTFSLGANAKLEVPPFGQTGPPSPAIHMKATAAAIREGSILFRRYCYYCHGVGAVSGSSIPDLRYATAETHHQFQSIVLGGDLEYGGMPSFKDALKPDQVKSIQAYVLSQAAAASKPAPSKAP
jgi:glucose dehydrogenase/mono/diheme cytochrome c family protein